MKILKLLAIFIIIMTLKALNSENSGTQINKNLKKEEAE